MEDDKWNPDQIEVKHVDTAITGDVNTTPVFTLLNGISQGADSDNRVGRTVVMSRINIRLQMTNETAVKDRLSQMRILLVYDRQTNGAVFNVTDVLDAVTLESQWNHDQTETRFLVLYDSVVPLNTYGGSATSVDVYHWFKSIEQFICLPTQYVDNGSTVASIVRGSLYLVYFGPDVASSTDFDCVGTCRLFYYDH